jgi:predicted nicotinamide N-methyase
MARTRHAGSVQRTDADTTDEVVVIAGRDLTITRPVDADALVDERAFEPDEFMPYWAELWPSSRALARRVGTRALHGARVLELGCGLGLPSIAAAQAGGRVVASDWSPEAIAAAAANAERNGVAVETLLCSWAAPGPLVERAPWDLVLAADVLYERPSVAVLLALLPRLAPEAWLADPGRPAAEAFLAQAGRRWPVETRIRDVVSIHRIQLA